MKQAYTVVNMKPDRMALLKLVNSIVTEYAGLGYRLSLRQLFYQLVARGHIPNTYRSYKRIGSLVTDGRNGGLIDWDAIEDRNRELVIPTHWRGPEHILRAAAESLTMDLWVGQEFHIELMVEKDALSGVVLPVCDKYDIGVTANKGYCSASTMREAGRRILRAHNSGKTPCVLYLGDHDPSGLDMTRDVEERLGLYSEGVGVTVERLALNWDQIEDWKPPKNPVKETDSRSDWYSRTYGHSSWELDAVEPKTLAGLVEEAILEKLDVSRFNSRVELVRGYRKQLVEIADQFEYGTEEDED